MTSSKEDAFVRSIMHGQQGIASSPILCLQDKDNSEQPALFRRKKIEESTNAIITPGQGPARISGPNGCEQEPGNPASFMVMVPFLLRPRSQGREEKEGNQKVLTPKHLFSFHYVLNKYE